MSSWQNGCVKESVSVNHYLFALITGKAGWQDDDNFVIKIIEDCNIIRSFC